MLEPVDKGMPQDGHQRADVLAAEIDRILAEVRRYPTIPAAKATCPCRLYWVASEAAEVARILEIHRCRGELTPEGLLALGRYERIYESAELALLAHFPDAHAEPPSPDL